MQHPPDDKATGEDNINLGRRGWLKGGVAAGLLTGVGAATLTACGGGGSTDTSGNTNTTPSGTTPSGSANNTSPGGGTTPTPPAGTAWQPKRTVIVMLENRSFNELIGSAEMPFLNQLASASALMTQSYAAPTPYNIVPVGGAPIAAKPNALTTTSWTKGAQFSHALPSRGSQTNYFYQFGGHNQGFLPDWYQQPGSGRAASTSLPAYQDQFGNLLLDTNGRPAPSFVGEIGLSNELVTSFANVSLPFTTPNLGAAIIGQGLTFATFSEALPYPSYNGQAFNPAGVSDGYARRHNPAINWINFPAYGKTVAADKQRFVLPMSCNLALRNSVDTDGTRYPGFGVDGNGNPAAFDQLPTVSLVVPNNMDNIHTGTLAAADTWLQTYIKPYADWAAANDGLLIITTDEDGFTDASNGVSNVATETQESPSGSYMYGMANITTLFFGPSSRVKPGQYASRIDHLNVLATVLDLYGALDSFKTDFQTAWSAATHPINAKWPGGTHPTRQRELSAQLGNLVPIKSFLA
ncbi:MAG: alkaline phosphatase family protein [Leptothrix sp. (in: b-proteobacteria)]